MPSRIIKDSIRQSDEIDSLNWFQETMFVRLITAVDDYGCFDAKPKLLRNVLYPTKGETEVTVEMIEEGLEALERVNIIKRYESDGKTYLYLVTWKEHQRIRNKTSRYPEPYDGYFQSVRQTDDSGSRTVDGNSRSNDGQLTSAKKPVAATRGETRPNPIQSNPIQNKKKEKNNSSFLEELEADEIRDEHDEIFNSMRRAGFQLNDSLMDTAIKLYTEHGKERMLYAIDQCAGASGNKLNYLKGVLNNKGKKTDDTSELKKAWALATKGVG